MRKLLLVLFFFSLSTICQSQSKEVLLAQLKSSDGCLDVVSLAIASRYLSENNTDSTDYFLNQSIDCSLSALCRIERTAQEAESIGLKVTQPQILYYARRSHPDVIATCLNFDITSWSHSKTNTESESEIDTLTRNTLLNIEKEDQRIRQGDQYNTNIKLHQSIDSLHLVEIDRIIRKHGRYPGRSIVGPEAESIGALVIHHNSIIADKYLDVLHQAVKTGDLDNAMYQIVLRRFMNVQYDLTQEQINSFLALDVTQSNTSDDIYKIFQLMEPYLYINKVVK
jgi:hypothetical protein